MIELKHICIGARCPICGKNVIGFVNRFQFASGTEISCMHCGSMVISIKKQTRENYMSLNCFACGEYHTYPISKKSFFLNGFYSLGCKKNEVDVLYSGSYEDVDNALYTLDEEIARLTDKYYQSLEKEYGACIISALRILEEKSRDKRIICICGSFELKLKLSSQGIEIICPECGGSEFIPMSADEDLNSLIERRSIIIK